MSNHLKINLERAMKEQGITQAKLAKAAGVSKTTLHGYLHPKNLQQKIDVTIVKRLCEILKLDFHEAIFGKPDPNSKSLIPNEVLTKIVEGDFRITVHKLNRK